MRFLQRRAFLSALTLSAGMALLGASALPAAAATAPVATPAAYRVIDLGTLGQGQWTYAYAINNRGHAVGESNGHAVLWRDGRVIDLGALPGDSQSVATDINERDQVVGYSGDGGAQRAFVWKNGHMRHLGELSYAGAAHGINDAGDIVGYSWADRPHAVLWRASRIIDLNRGDFQSFAYDISNDGWIVGERYTPDDTMNPNAVLWRNGHLTELFPGSATAVNERHQIIGSDSGRAFLWYRGVATGLMCPPSEWGWCQPNGINERGQIAGSTGFDAVVWPPSGDAVYLPRLAGSSTGAHDINNRGQVVGSSSVTPEGLTRHAVLWTR
jgi:probable HAF family extracellular repeat protein